MITLNIKMPRALVGPYNQELAKYQKALDLLDFEQAWHHLERAHIIGQRYPWQHTETHWKMLCLGMTERKPSEVFGQVIRLIFGAPLSILNKIPAGNVGSTRVSILASQKIPEDIQSIFLNSKNT